MMGNEPPHGSPLRAGDPRRLGRYTMISRLGEGGMGTVYLAQTPDGVPVAVKVIRGDLAHDDQFRRRFRSEVNRARQVPPFCTAEVLDADPDHEMPHLVVEFVDGPSLSDVVRQRGPLTQSNLHGLAIGVATALTAIHGAGVVHRDLKPNNVLLAAGSPKVIDFGIAHSPTATTGHTRTDQMVGTVAYMAPERFGPIDGPPVTPAVDIFSWGAVIAYAATGRNPFGSDAAPVIATRILTQPPDLTGLSGLLRDLVEEALAKDPADRPTARALLDRLLVAGPSQPSAVAAAFARQPALQVAAEEAVQATDRHGAAAPGAAAPGAGDATQRHAFSGDADATTRFAENARPEAAVVPPGAAVSPPAAGSGRGRGGRVAVVLVAIAAIVTSLTVAGLVSGVIPLPTRAEPSEPSTASTGAAGPTAPAGPDPSGRVLVADALAAPGVWQVRDDKENRATCLFDNALVVTRQSGGSYRCPGVQDEVTDFAMTVDVRLRTAGSCAGIWFRFVSTGYVLRICAGGHSLATHGVEGSATVTPVTTFPPTALPLDTVTRIGITAKGKSLTFTRDGRAAGTWTEARFLRGRVVLGILQESQTTEPPPYSVSFANVEIRT
ncbi:serine/threonine-protein kinase [Dactylosporangium sp. NPDC005555]|uniref:serine/threonine protein kinase n=1 Tax=Dactylosporangium sp. NPDC005555 TaxID=3154889 RepID=UPI0033B50DA9